MSRQRSTIVTGCKQCPEPQAFAPVLLRHTVWEDEMGKGILLWLLGVPIPVIIILWLIFR